MVEYGVGESSGHWFAIAWEEERFVATAEGSNSERAIESLRRCVPDGVRLALRARPGSFFDRALTMLGELEQGIEAHKRFEISPLHRSEASRRILTKAAAIPIGFVTTYGDIATAAGSEARAVGRAMATNPLYPIVPCHRVVGVEMALVGYGGRQDEDALQDKLSRLKSETRGVVAEQDIRIDGRVLTVYPVERVIAAERRLRERRLADERRKAEAEAADRLQIRLF